MKTGARAVLGAILLMTGLLATVAPAQASPGWTTLCRGYTTCANAGMGNDGYAAHNGTMYWRMYAGHNCVNYAAYRMVHSGMPNVRPWSGGGNAMYWGTYNAKITDSTPTVGAIAWWKANSGPAGSAGHVGYVEKVISANEIIVSMDWWGGDFSWARVVKGYGYFPDGFIHFNDRKMAVGSAPAVRGTAQVGQTLTSTAATFSPSADSVSYQWRANGTDIAGATGQSLDLGPAQVGKRITVKATATKAAYPSVASVSAATVAVAPGALISTAAPEISGATRVGATLTSSVAAWSPAGADVSYQWRGDSVDIAGATGRTLTLSHVLEGQRISVVATATRPGYATASRSSAATEPIASDVLTNTEAPAVSGTPVVDRVLTAVPGAWTPAPGRLAYQWLVNGRAVTGATAPTLTTTPELVGKTVSVRVTARKYGYDPVSVKTAPTSQVAPGTFVAERTPTITGETRTDQRLTLDPGAWSPEGTVAVQWLRNGVAVPGATGTTYRLTADDLTARMSATSTVTRDGYTTVTATAPATTTVRTTPQVGVGLRVGARHRYLDVTITANGVTTVSGQVGVFRRGVQIGAGSLRGGVLHVQVPDQVRPGSRLFRISYAGSPAVLDRTVWRRVTLP